MTAGVSVSESASMSCTHCVCLYTECVRVHSMCVYTLCVCVHTVCVCTRDPPIIHHHPLEPHTGPDRAGRVLKGRLQFETHPLRERESVKERE